MRRIVSVVLLIVFVVTASLPGYSHPFYKHTAATYQNQLESLTVGFSPDWQKTTVHPKVQLGSVWNVVLKTVRISEAPDIGVHNINFRVPKANAP